MYVRLKLYYKDLIHRTAIKIFLGRKKNIRDDPLQKEIFLQ